MNITQELAHILEVLGYGTVGNNIFISTLPLDAPDNCFWLVGSGGTVRSWNTTSEMIKEYRVDIYYRAIKGDDAYNTIEKLERDLNSLDYINSSSYNIINLQVVNFPADTDLDNQERIISTMQVEIQVYYKKYGIS